MKSFLPILFKVLNTVQQSKTDKHVHVRYLTLNYQ